MTKNDFLLLKQTAITFLYLRLSEVGLLHPETFARPGLSQTHFCLAISLDNHAASLRPSNTLAHVLFDNVYNTNSSKPRDSNPSRTKQEGKEGIYRNRVWNDILFSL